MSPQKPLGRERKKLKKFKKPQRKGAKEGNMSRLPKVGQSEEVLVKMGRNADLPVIFDRNGLIGIPKGIRWSLMVEMAEILPDTINDIYIGPWFLRVQVVGHARSGRAIFCSCKNIEQEIAARRANIATKIEEHRLLKVAEEEERRKQEEEEKKRIAKMKDIQKAVLSEVASLGFKTKGEIPPKVVFTTKGEEEPHPLISANCYGNCSSCEKDCFVHICKAEYGQSRNAVEREISTILDKVKDSRRLDDRHRRELIEKLLKANYQEIIWRHPEKDCIQDVTYERVV